MPLLLPEQGTPCPYEAHRPSDWRKVGPKGDGPPTCGRCHPPVPALVAAGLVKRVRQPAPA